MAKLDFGIYPKPVREKLLALRQMIFDGEDNAGSWAA